MLKKKYKYNQIKLASFCRSLGNPSRVAVIEKIAEMQSCVCDEIIEINNLTKTSTAAHIVSLKKEGIIKGSVSRSKLFYCIDWDKLDEFKVLFDELYNNVKKHQQKVTSQDKICN
ncbi:MAG: helix-turn-helix transcriptional regulator [Bacteroidia bacterium]|nr:helix-turn-helix transcriptional regulator [Bacteroidia bacterium]